MKTQTLELDEAIASLYLAFKKYGGRAEVRDGDPYGGGDNSYGRLLAETPLNQLSGSDLMLFEVDMHASRGGDGDLKMLLRRILELYAKGEGSLSLLSVYGRLRRAFDRWPSLERDAVQMFTRSFFADAIRHRFAPSAQRRPVGAFEIVECAALCEIDIVQLLDQWIAARHPELASSLADHVIHNQWRLLDSHRWGGLLKLEFSNPVAEWVRSGRAGQFLLAAVEAYPTHPECSRWAEAFDVLDALDV